MRTLKIVALGTLFFVVGTVGYLLLGVLIGITRGGMNDDRCKQCIAWFRQTDKELKTIKLLAAWRKSRNKHGDGEQPEL